MDSWEINLKGRKSQRIGDSFNNKSSKQHFKVLLSSSDMGVIRNGGRNGARHAPPCLLHHFKKLIGHSKTPSFSEHLISDSEQEQNDFSLAQKTEYQNIKNQLSDHMIHLGGGHDHIYPFAKALIEKHGKLTIINIDAHLDTRKDEIHHSGTPFRQLAEEFKAKLTLIQVGIQNTANTKENYSDLEMDIITVADFKNGKNISMPTDGPLLLSIDCDGIDGSIMPAVSAVNPYGLNQADMFLIAKQVKKYWQSNQHCLVGFYEFNPIYDDLSSMGAKFISYYLNHLIQDSA